MSSPNGKKPRDSSFYWYLASRIGAGAAGVVSIRYLVAFLSREDFGELGYFKVFAAALLPIVTLSLPAAMLRMYFDRKADDHVEQRRLVSTTYRVAWLAVGVLALFAGVYRFIAPADYVWLYVLSVATSTVFIGFFNYLLQARNDYRLYFANRLLESGGFLALIATADAWVDGPIARSVLGGNDLALVIGMYAVVQWAVVLLDSGIYLTRGVLSARARALSWPELGALVRYSAPLSVTYFLGWTLNSSDAFMLEHLSTPTQLGDYVFAASMVSFVGIISQSVLTDFPRFYYAKMRDEPDPGARDGAINRRVRFYLVFHIVAILLLRLVIGFAYELFGASEYRAGIDYIGYLLLGNYFFLAGNIYAAGLGYAKKTHLVTVVWAIPGALNVGLNLIFIPIWGAHAAALTTVGAFALYAALGWRIGAPYYRFTDWRGHLVMTLLACLAGLLPF